MLFKEFCEKALSNDVICIVDDVVNRNLIREPVAAYRFLLDDDSPTKPEWANEVLSKKVERFTIAVDCYHNKKSFLVKLNEK